MSWLSVRGIITKLTANEAYSIFAGAALSIATISTIYFPVLNESSTNFRVIMELYLRFYYNVLTQTESVSALSINSHELNNTYVVFMHYDSSTAGFGGSFSNNNMTYAGEFDAEL